jgi:nucleotide-binding universal stress UspA family protein
MENVLVPFDESKSARRAIQYLIDRAELFAGQKLHVINVQDEVKVFGDCLTQSMIDEMHERAIAYSSEFTASAAAMLKGTGLRFETHELIGDAPAEIAKAVKEYDCHLVVMGTRGMSKLGNLLMGSVATRVIHEVDVPVLLVK